VKMVYCSLLLIFFWNSWPDY